MLNEILFYSPTILCLQEAQKEHFYKDILPVLEENQYELAVYKKRTSENKYDGCAILFKKNVLKLKEERTCAVCTRSSNIRQRQCSSYV